MRAPIVSRKHIFQHTQTNITSGAVSTQEEARAVATQDVNAPNEVIEGSVVKAIFIEYWLIGATNEGSFVLIVEKALGLQANPTITNMTTLDAYPNKKNVLFISQGLISSDAGGNPTPVLRQWIKIPKGKQRMGLGDRIRVSIAAIGAEDVTFCGFVVYKSYS